MSDRYSYPKEKIKVLLLEGISSAAIERLNNAGYATVDVRKEALSEDELAAQLAGVHLLGIRSKTRVTARVLESAKNLLGIGCYCIGTDQVDLAAASLRGVPVFNAPFSNTRSVAELTMAEVVMLARKAAQRSMQLHRGVWEKSAVGCHEIRNKVLGIIGYGHIGPQVGLLAESFGMKVLFFDIVNKLPLGTAVQLGSMKEVLERADFVTLHVPDTRDTRGMISANELSLMKRGSFLLNLSRGTVVNLKALKQALTSGHLAGSALDVFPEEPDSNCDDFRVELAGQENVILTPHIGGSTEEAQRNIGVEVSDTLVKFTDTGSSSGAVNFPQVELPLLRDSHRVLNVHKNVPGVLKEINSIIAAMGVNIKAQYLNTYNEIGYLIMDVDPTLSREVKKNIDALATNIRTRLLF